MYTWYRVLILVPRVHVVYFSSLSQVVNYPMSDLHKRIKDEYGKPVAGVVVWTREQESEVTKHNFMSI